MEIPLWQTLTPPCFSVFPPADIFPVFPVSEKTVGKSKRAMRGDRTHCSCIVNVSEMLPSVLEIAESKLPWFFPLGVPSLCPAFQGASGAARGDEQEDYRPEPSIPEHSCYDATAQAVWQWCSRACLVNDYLTVFISAAVPLKTFQHQYYLLLHFSRFRTWSSRKHTGAYFKPQLLWQGGGLRCFLLL